MNLDARPVHQDQFQSEVVDNEVILYFPDGGQFLYLNQTAALVWERCDGTLSCHAIIQAIQSVFPEAADDIQRDVEDTLQTFLRHGCIALL